MFNITHSVLRDPSTEGNGGAAQGGSGANPFAPSNTTTSNETQQTSQQSTGSQQTTQQTSQQQGATGSSQSTTGQATQPTQQSTQQQVTQAQQPSAVQLSPEQLQQLIQAARPPAQSAEQAQPPMTEGEFKKLFNIFEATPEMYEAILGVKPDNPQRVTALNDALQSVSRQSITILRHLMDQRFKEMDGRFQPVQATIQQQREQQAFQEFTTEYPGLKDYGPMLREIVDAARSRGMSFTNLNDAKTYVAAQAAKLLGKQVTDFKTAPATQGTNNQTSQQSGTRSMSTTSMGGRSGSSGGAAPSQTTAERLFSGQS